MDYAGLPGQVQRVRETIARHQGVGGWSHPVEIIAVTKTHGSEAARAAFEAGLTAVGENRVQEALAKLPEVAHLPLQWHLIGPLQRNKVKHVVGRFVMVQTVDRLELVEEFTRRLPPGQQQRVLLEVNCSDESQKAGVAPEGLPALLEALEGHEGLQVEGLMTMAPFTEDVEVQRSAFRRLRLLRDQAERRGWRLPHLSMGMSGDFPTAVEEGATMIRLGTILFGERTR